MLKFFRKKKVMKRIFWGLAILIIPAFTLWGVGSAVRQKERGPSYAGKIFNKKISFREYEAAYRATEIQGRLAYGEKFDEISKFLNVGNQAWDRLLLLEECRRNKITVSDKELSAKIASFPFFQRDGRFDIELYNRVMKYFFRCEPKFFEETIRDSVKISQLIDKKRGKTTISDDELKKLYREVHEKAKISFLLYDVNSFRKDAAISDEEIAKYYGANKKDFGLPEEVTIDYLEFIYKDFEKNISVADTDLAEYYDSHIKEFEKPEEVRARHILVKTEAEAKEILDLLKKNPQSFEALAKERSLDPGSKENGGDLGYFARGRMVKEFENAAFSLEPGRVSDIIKSQYGYHIIKLEDKKNAYTRTLAEVKVEIKNKLLKTKSRELAIKKGEETAGKLEGNPKDFEKIAQEENLSIKTTGPFAKNGFIPNIGFLPTIHETAFDMKTGDVSGLLSDEENQNAPASYIIRLKAKLSARTQELSEVKEKISGIVTTKKAAELAFTKARADYETITTMVQESIALDEIAEILELNLQQSNEFTRAGSIAKLGPASEVAGAVFSLKVGELSEPLAIQRGACIVQLNEIIGIDEKKFKEEAESFRAEQFQIKENKIFEAYMKDLSERATMKMYIHSLEDIYK